VYDSGKFKRYEKKYLLPQKHMMLLMPLWKDNGYGPFREKSKSNISFEPRNFRWVEDPLENRNIKKTLLWGPLERERTPRGLFGN